MAKYTLIFLISLFWLGIHITKPFIGHHDWNGAFYSLIAANYDRFGLIVTKLGQMTAPQNFYTHYPPLLTLIMAAFFKLFGIKDVVARIVPLLFYAGGITLLVAISRRLTVLILLMTPMLRYFSQMPSQEALIFFFSCLSIYAYLNKKTKLFYFSVVANGLSGWAGYFLYPFLLLKNRRLFLKTGLILAVIFCLHLVHTYLLTGQLAGGGLFDAFLLRLGLFPALNRAEPELAGQFSWLGYLIKEARMLTVYYSLTLVSLALAGLLLCRDKLTLILLAWGLSYPLIFSNIVFVHEYFNIYLAPFLALSLVNLVSRLKLKWFVLPIIFGLVFLERNKFYQALIATEAFRPGYELGLQIKASTPPGETAKVYNSAEFIKSQSLFIDYYSDRQIEYIKTDGLNN